MNAQTARNEPLSLPTDTPAMAGPAEVWSRESDFERGAPRGSRSGRLWRHRAVCMPPLVAEGALFLAATHLALALGRVMGGTAPMADWAWVLAGVAVFTAIYVYSGWRELFMPRAVVLAAAGGFGLVAAGMLAGLVAPTPWHAAFDDLPFLYRMLAGLPLVFFLIRLFALVRAARYSPALSDLDRRGKSAGRGLWAECGRRLEFWMR
jgi:hypothetical protein